MEEQMDEYTFADYCQHAGTEPQNFAEDFEHSIDNGWGFTHLSQHRDSEARERSNWRVETKDLLERYPGAFFVARYGHPLVGWVEQLKVRLDNQEALQAAFDWYERVRNSWNQVADDDDLAQLEQEEEDEYLAPIIVEAQERLEEFASQWEGNEDTDGAAHSWAVDKVLTWLREDYRLEDEYMETVASELKGE